MLSFLIVFLLAFAGDSLQAQENKIHWYKDLDEAVEAAQQTDRPMMIDFWADWCAPCRIMDAEVYTDPELITVFREKMIGVRIHFDLQPDMVRKFNVLALPYLLFTNSYGTELLAHQGMLDAPAMTTIVNAFPDDIAEINRIDRILQEDKNDFPALVEMARKLREKGFYDSSNGFFQRTLRHDQAKKNAAEREVILYTMGLNSLVLQDGKAAASSLERCLKEFPASDHKPKILLALGRVYLLREDEKKAKRTLTSVVKEFPESLSAQTARELLNSL